MSATLIAGTKLRIEKIPSLRCLPRRMAARPLATVTRRGRRRARGGRRPPPREEGRALFPMPEPPAFSSVTFPLSPVQQTLDSPGFSQDFCDSECFSSPGQTPGSAEFPIDLGRSIRDEPPVSSEAR